MPKIDDLRRQYDDAKREILLKLDIVAEYRALGVEVVGSSPNRKGFIEAKSPGVEDRNPSAGINVVDGPYLGLIKNFRGETTGLFQYAAQQGRFGGDWRLVRRHYAEKTGVKLPSQNEELVADHFDFYDITNLTRQIYAEGKPGVTSRSIEEVGGRVARWPAKLQPEKANHLIAFPMYGSALLDLEPIGWHCVPQKPTGKIRKYRGRIPPPTISTR